ncbi:hypothetical protein IMSAG049_00486 [Clostridiales bacterium]|nr:hypothetical protein IMSAG049_00486 [Clostridiales bacterium]
MKEYKFDENKSMGETVRIDDIKLRLNEMDEQNGYENDYDSFEDYEDFESDDTGEIVPRKRQKAPERKSPKGGGNKTLLYIIAAIVMVIVVASAIFLTMSLGEKKSENEEEAVIAEYFYGVVNSVSDNKFEITNTESGKIAFYTIGSSVDITKEDGRKTAYSTITRGDIIYIGVSKETGDIVSIEYTDDVWTKQGFGEIEINSDEKTISNGVTGYDYDKNTLFIYNGDFIKDSELVKEDVVTLRGIGSKVWTVTVEKYHGFIKLENVERIESPKITIDGEETEFVDNQKAVSAGAHSLGISGSNIDTLTVDIHITAGETYSVDMASIQEKTGVLTLKVNVDDCIIVVNGKQVDKESPVVLNLGSYPISVSAEGYKTYSGTVDINEPLVEVNIELEKIEIKTATITVETTPPGATVYANEAVIGVTPFTTQINYGSYDILIKKESYSDYSLNTTVNEDQKTISVLLTEE